MSLPDPTCTINGSPTPQDVPAGSTVNGALANTSGANQWAVSIVSCDDSSVLATLQASLTVNQGAKTFSFTAPSGLGACVILQSQVGVRGLGLDTNLQPQKSFTTTFKVNVLSATGQRVTAPNEEGEQDPVNGWTKILNAILRGLTGGSLNTQKALRTLETVFFRTTNNSPQVAFTVAMATAPSIARFNVRYEARDITTIANSGSGEVQGLFSNAAGTAAQIGSTQSIGTAIGSPAVTFGVTGGSVQVKVTGVAADTIDWALYLDIGNT